jgi:hypothetical protein
MELIIPMKTQIVYNMVTFSTTGVMLTKKQEEKAVILNFPDGKKPCKQSNCSCITTDSADSRS